MNAPEILELDPGLVLPALRRMLRLNQRDEPLAVQELVVEKMPGGLGNPVSLGLFRISGRASSAAGEQDFALVLKAIRSPALVGMTNMGEADDPAHWNYWRREALFYQSALPEQLPAGLLTADCYGVQGWDDPVIWIWLEEVGGESAQVGQPAGLRTLARQLGRLNGQWLEAAQLAQINWLGRRTHAQWVAMTSGFPPGIFTPANTPNWQHPLLQALFPSAESAELRQFWDEHAHFLALCDALPATLAHGDSAHTNFKLRHTADGKEQVVALDWALVNQGILGQDVAHLVFALGESLEAEQQQALVQELLGSYLQGLRETGWRGDERQVWLGYALTILLKLGVFVIIFAVLGLKEEIDPAAQVTDQLRAVARMLQQAAHLVYTMSDRPV